MKSEPAIDRVRRDLHCALDNMRADFERIEILSAALGAFSKPIPEYEPGFRHVHNLTLGAYQIG